MTLLTDRNKNHGTSVQMDINDHKDSNLVEIIQKKESAAFLQPAFAPKMMSVSKFLEPFDETSLTDEEASQKYSAYVAGFLKEQLAEQFEHNKTSAWFRDKYHPDHIISKEKERETLLTRFEIFKKMREMGFFNEISLEYKERVAITKLLDQFAILLAGGNSDDLADLEKFDPTASMLPGDLSRDVKQPPKSEPSEANPKKRSLSPKTPKRLVKKCSTKRQKASKTHKEKQPKTEGGDGNSSDSSTSSSSSTGSSSSNSSSSSFSNSSSRSRQRSSSTHSTSSTSGSSVISSSSSSSNHSSVSGTSKASKKIKEAKKDGKTEPEVEQECNAEELKKEGVEMEGVEEETVEEEMEKKSLKIPLHATRVVYLPYLPLSIHRATIETLLSEHPDYLRFACLEPTPLPAATLNIVESPSMLLLHRPAWITFTPVASESSPSPTEFIRQLVNRLRVDVASNDTSEASDLAAALSAARTLPGAFNIDRIRASTRLARILMSTTDKAPFNPIASKFVMRRHLVMAARLAGRLDEIWGLWKEPCDPENAEWPIPRASDLDPRCGTGHVDLVDLASRTGNPLLESITDHLVDEFNSEEELLLVSSGASKPSGKKEDGGKSQEAGKELARALDSLLIYLRLVYSIDFYAPALYHRESDMPHPCSVFHVRPSKIPESVMSSTFSLLRVMPPPPNPVFKKEVTSKSAHKVFARQISRIFRLVTPLAIGTITNVRDIDATTGENASAAMENSEASKLQREMDANENRLRLLGYRDVNEVVEAFIKANTKRKKRKVDVIWICPLSEKKFRGPGFVRKHILNKHAEKVEMEKKEKAYFFNNFLMDPMRPELMHPPRRQLPIHLRRIRASSVADDENEDEVDVEHSPRERRPAPRVRDDFQPSTTRYWNVRNNGYGNYYGGRGGPSFGNGPRRYGRLNNPWGGASGYNRQGSNRTNGYRDLDAPN